MNNEVKDLTYNVESNSETSKNYSNKNIFLRFVIEILNRVFDDSSIVKKIENSKWFNKILIVLGAIVLYFFYNLGYAFLYGYYFGGDLDDKVPLIDMFVNPIPFNFKSIVFIGILLLMYIIMTFLPLGKIVLSNKIKDKILWFLVFLIGSIIYIIGSGWTFIGDFDNKVLFSMMYFIIVLISIPLSIFFTLIFFMYYSKYNYKFYSSVGYNLVFVIIGIGVINKFYPIPNNYLETVVFYAVFIGPIFVTIIGKVIWRKIIRSRNTIIYKTLLWFPSSVIISIIIALIMNIKCISYKFAIILLINILALVTIVLIRNAVIRKSKKEKNNVICSNVTTIKNNKNNTVIYMLIIIMIAVVVLPMIPHVTVEMGKITRLTIVGLSKEKIIYEKADDKKDFKYIFGNVVAEKNNTYFVSKLPERKLMTIKNTNVLSIPCEEFKINTNVDKFYDIDKNLDDKYDYFKLNTNIKIKQDYNPNNIQNRNINFIKNVYLKTSSNIDDNNYDFGISIKVNYEVNKNESIKNFKITFGEKFPNNNDDRKLKDEMENLNLDYKNAIIEYFKLPLLDGNNNTYYYSNGRIDIIEQLNDNFNGRYELEYIFSSDIN
ncbi:hypothetical protein KPL40_01845 [Clostridium gasigenes]|uniref:hypothetical protein n=1 Tax=Clostridium gasigenes TaxID=94869 RepID=UPI001C0CF4C8|nr:hypothetical protein [Clostridium gasigenes]MBU3131180.1 hypothetical protein [Clostridium gasigenes]